ncbi:MAG: hypothetical protein WCR40_00140 [Candidatus Paceibacterota bacterium]
MKKKISILIFLFVFGIFFTSAIAQENTQVGDSEQFFENRPEVYVSDLKLDKTEYKAGDVVTGSVKVSNVKTSFVSNLNLKVSLVGGYKNSLYSVDYYNEKIDSISVKGKEAMLVSFSFALPVSSEAYSDEGQIGIKVKAFTDNGAPLGWDDTSIKIVGSSLPVVKANDAFVNVDGNNFTLQSGPTVYDGKKVSFNVSLFSSEDMVVSPDVVVYSMQNAKEPITSFKAKSISLKKQVKNTVSIDLPTFNNEKPGIYYGDIVFKDANNINRTSVFSFRYIIFGYVINVVNAITDKTSFDKGENINLSISYTGPAGDILELINDKETTDATSTKEVEKVDLTVKLFNEKQVLVAEYSGKADYISFASKNVLLTSTGKAKSTYTEVSFAKDGKVIGYYETKLSGDFDLIKYNLEKQQQILEVVILIVIIIIILLFVIFLKMKAKNKKGIILPMLVVLGLGFCFNNAFAWDEFHHSVYTDKFSSLMPSISLSSPSGLYSPGETITVSGTSYTLVCSNDDTFDVKYYVKGTTDLTSPNDYNCDDGPRCLESQSKMLKEFEDRFG